MLRINEETYFNALLWLMGILLLATLLTTGCGGGGTDVNLPKEPDTSRDVQVTVNAKNKCMVGAVIIEVNSVNECSAKDGDIVEEPKPEPTPEPEVK